MSNFFFFFTILVSPYMIPDMNYFGYIPVEGVSILFHNSEITLL